MNTEQLQELGNQILGQGFWQKHSKWLLPVIGLLIFAAGFGTAMVAGPAKTVTKTEVVTKIETETQVKVLDHYVNTVTIAQKVVVHEHTTTTETKKPDGTDTTTTTSDKDTSTATDTKNATDATHQETQVVTQVVEKVVEKEKIVTQQPGWAVHAGAGISIPYYLQGPTTDIGIPGMKGVVVDAGIDRRIAGPFWLGVKGNTQGTVGLDLRLAW